MVRIPLPLVVVLPVVLALGASACRSLYIPSPKPIPAAVNDDAALDREAMRIFASSISNAEPLSARVVSPFRVELDPLTSAPVRRFVDIVIVSKSKVVDDGCMWEQYRFWQTHAGGGTYETALHSAGSVKLGGLDCASPEAQGN